MNDNRYSSLDLHGLRGQRSLYLPSIKTPKDGRELFTEPPEDFQAMIFSVEYDRDAYQRGVKVEIACQKDTAFLNDPDEPLWITSSADLEWRDIEQLRDYLTFLLTAMKPIG